LNEALEKTDTLGKKHQHYGILLDNIAGLNLHLGKKEEALAYCSKALKEIEEISGKSHIDYLKCLHNMISICIDLGLKERAMQLAIELMEAIEVTNAENTLIHASNMSNLGSLHLSDGDLLKALSYKRQAVDVLREILGESHRDYLIALNSLTLVYVAMGAYNKAMSTLSECINTSEVELGKKHPAYGAFLNNLASIHLKMSNPHLALPLYRQALQNNYHQLNQGFSFLSEAEKEKFSNTLIYNFEVYQSFFLDYQPQQPEVSGDAYDLELARKGMLLRTGIQMREALKAEGDTATLALYDDWQGRKRILAAEGNKPIAERRADLPTLEAEAEKIERELAQRSVPFRENKRLGTARWQDVQSRLQPGEVAIEFAAFRYRDAQRWTDSTQYMALLLRPGMAHPELIPLFEQRRLDSLLSKAGSLTSSNPSSLYRGGDPDDDNKQPSYGKELYELVFAPIQSRLQAGDSVIYFSPAGGLHRVSFAALPLDDKKRLMDHYRLVQLGSTRELLREESQKLPAGSSIALFGGMDYQPDTLAWTAAAGQVPGMIPFGRSWRNELYKDVGAFDRLSGALAEVEAVARLAQVRASMWPNTRARRP
jgi:hypothetical protein